ncbi:T6SS phospholipase effector Tle1-like catalytic domain-containing protein [Burkholderia stagnalis]|uniref:T6SS phospholipase effector Tle1-like catalytic domain-containing protein n=1 Tax=Burkholderia stagnalis TaxID=1503054 RepID=UPI00075F39ED|nr:DUF2235 domain-containing protein [Burkholderia stagnalis]KWI26788.1 hypothetical protein WT71_00970 [Burkholderia stagnalis]KWI81330.1 hypothetical protein WT73_27725 [Burkholderia stagnalis]
MSVICWPEKMSRSGRLMGGESAKEIGARKICDSGSTCARTLHVTIFFDGTNNNREWDIKDKERPSHTNVARLFDVCGDLSEQGQYKFYIPGVGTPFKEIGEMEFSSSGKAMAMGFGKRVAWGYTRILNAINDALVGNELLKDPGARVLCEKMDNAEMAENRIAAQFALLMGHGPLALHRAYKIGNAARRDLALAMLHREVAAEQNKNLKFGGRPDKAIKKVWVNVFGFSRGAAEARVFVNKLINTWAKNGKIAGVIPYEVNFVGLFDTVASVGIPDTATAIDKVADWQSLDGHWGWASNGALNIPKQVRRCVHFFSIHEQRMSFPVDSIRMGTSYQGDSSRLREIAYPGVHSDIGGGYPYNDQGKSQDGDGSKLSQIPLHDMYIEALAAGVPLMLKDKFEGDDEIARGFDISDDVVCAFNDWLATVKDRPLDRVETAMQIGMAQSLSWRALRSDISNPGKYITHQSFFVTALEDTQTPHEVETRLADLTRQREDLRRRRDQMRGAAASVVRIPQLRESFEKQVAQLDAQLKRVPVPTVETAAEGDKKSRPGEDAYDIVTNDKTDLLESAEEFRLLMAYLRPEQKARWQVYWSDASHYYKASRTGANYFLTVRHSAIPGRKTVDSPEARLIKRDWIVQSQSLLAAHHPKYDFVLAPPDAMLPFLLEHTSDEAVRKLAPATIRLFDDYIHDSRAWFRVPRFHEYSTGGYGWARVIFVGDDTRVRHLGFTGNGATEAKTRAAQEAQDLGAWIAARPTISRSSTPASRLAHPMGFGGLR